MDEDAVAYIDYANVKHAVTGVRGFLAADTVSVTNSAFDYIEVDGIYAAGGDTTTVILSGNTVSVRGGVGIAATSENLSISGYTVTDEVGTSLKGIELGATSSGQLISGTASSDFAAGSALWVGGNAGEAPTVKQSTFEDSKWGVYVTTSDIRIGTTSSSDANTIQGNTTAGILATGSNAKPVVRYNSIDSNKHGVWVQSGAAPDLGSSATGNGNNKITNSTTYCIWNRNAGGTPQVKAEGNYFGACSGGLPPTCWSGNVLVTNYQCSAPFGVDIDVVAVPDGRLQVTRLGARPNPMPGSGAISFEVAEGRSTARVRIYDVAGRLVRDLGEHEVGIGTHSITWDGHTDNGTHARSGVYFVRLTLPGVDPVVSKLVMAR